MGLLSELAATIEALFPGTLLFCPATHGVLQYMQQRHEVAPLAIPTNAILMSGAGRCVCRHRSPEAVVRLNLTDSCTNPMFLAVLFSTLLLCSAAERIQAASYLNSTANSIASALSSEGSALNNATLLQQAKVGSLDSAGSIRVTFRCIHIDVALVQCAVKAVGCPHPCPAPCWVYVAPACLQWGGLLWSFCQAFLKDHFFRAWTRSYIHPTTPPPAHPYLPQDITALTAAQQVPVTSLSGPMAVQVRDGAVLGVCTRHQTVVAADRFLQLMI